MFSTLEILERICEPETWKATVRLRWREVLGARLPVLEQLWIRNGDSKEEWREIETIKAE